MYFKSVSFVFIVKGDFIFLLIFVDRQMHKQSKVRPLLMERLGGRVKVAPGKCF